MASESCKNVKSSGICHFESNPCDFLTNQVKWHCKLLGKATEQKPAS